MRRTATHPLSVVASTSGALLLAWAALSALWSGSALPGAFLTLALIAATAALGCLPALAVRSEQAWARLLHDGAAAMVAATGLHVLFLVDHTGRVQLPIGAASTAHMPLLLALAVLVGALLRGGTVLAQAARTVLVLVTLALLANGSSRVGVVTTSALCLALAVRVARTRPQLRWPALGAGLAVAALLAATALWMRPELSLADGARSENHRAALRQLTSPLPQVLVGEGWTGLWPWLALELSPPDGWLPAWRDTPEGRLLWHPHSLYLGVVGELGLVGAVLLATLVLAVLVGCDIVWFRDDAISPAALALALTIPGMAFDLLLVRDYPGSLLWWLVAGAVLQRAGCSTAVPRLLGRAAARTPFAPAPLRFRGRLRGSPRHP